MGSGRTKRRDSRERVKPKASRTRINLGDILNATGGRRTRIFALAILCVAAWLPIHNISLPMQYDETFTLDNFAVQSIHTIVTDYRLPNNHIALSLMLNAWWKLNGRPDPVQFGEAMWRIPVVVLSIVGYLAFFLFVLRAIVRDAIAAALGTLTLSSIPLATEYAHQLRGYGPCISYFCILLAALAFASEMHWVAFATVGFITTFLATYTLPTSVWYLLPAVAGAAVYLLRLNAEASWSNYAGSRWNWIRRGTLSRFFLVRFLPLALGPIAAVIAFSFATIDQGNLSHSIGQSLRFLASDFFRFWKFTMNCVAPTGHWMAGLVLAIPAVVMLVLRIRRGSQTLKFAWLILPVILLSPIIAGAMTDRAFERNFSGAIPWYVALDTWLVVELSEALTKARPGMLNIATSRRTLLAVLGLTALTFGLLKSRDLRDYFAPREIFAYLKQNMGARSIGAYDMESDAHSLDFYGRANGLSRRFNYYEYVPEHLPPGIESFFLLSSSDDNLKQMLKRFGLNFKQGTPAFHEAGKFGRSKMYRIDFESAP